MAILEARFGAALRPNAFRRGRSGRSVWPARIALMPALRDPSHATPCRNANRFLPNRGRNPGWSVVFSRSDIASSIRPSIASACARTARREPPRPRFARGSPLGSIAPSNCPESTAESDRSLAGPKTTPSGGVPGSKSRLWREFPWRTRRSREFSVGDFSGTRRVLPDRLEKRPIKRGSTDSSLECQTNSEG
jgi:hypothetical protein